MSMPGDLSDSLSATSAYHKPRRVSERRRNLRVPVTRRSRRLAGAKPEAPVPLTPPPRRRTGFQPQSAVVPPQAAAVPPQATAVPLQAAAVPPQAAAVPPEAAADSLGTFWKDPCFQDPVISLGDLPEENSGSEDSTGRS